MHHSCKHRLSKLISYRIYLYEMNSEPLPLGKFEMDGENDALGGPIQSTKLDISALEPSFRIGFYDVALR